MKTEASEADYGGPAVVNIAPHDENGRTFVGHHPTEHPVEKLMLKPGRRTGKVGASVASIPS